MKSALRGMPQTNLDLGILQDKNITGGVYTRGLAGYSVVTMDTPIRHCGGVTFFYRPSTKYTVEAIQQFEPNAVGFQMATGDQRWYIIGCYLAPDNTLTMESVVAALKERPRE